MAHGIGNLVNNLAKRQPTLSDLLGDQSDCGPGLESALEGNVRSRAAHELDEMPVFAGGNRIALDVAD